MHTRHLALTHLFLFALLLGCHSNNTPPPSLTTQNEEEAKEDPPPILSPVTLPEQEENAWTESLHISLLGFQVHPYGDAIHILFDRPPDKTTVKIEFQYELAQFWASPQLLVLSPTEELPVGSHELIISDTLQGQDGTMPTESIVKQFYVYHRPTPPPISEESKSPTSPSSHSPKKARAHHKEAPLHLMHFGHVTGGRDDNQIPGDKLKLQFVSTAKIPDNRLDKAAQITYMVYSSDPSKHQTKIVPSRVVYRGKKKTGEAYNGFPFKYLYQVQPLEPLEINKSYSFGVNEDLSYNYFTYKDFTPLPSKFEAKLTIMGTSTSLITTQPIDADALKECIKITPKPRVYDVDEETTWSPFIYEIDINPAMPGMTYTLDLDSCLSRSGNKLVGKTRLQATLQHYFQPDDYGYEEKIRRQKIWSPLSAQQPLILEAEEVARTPILPLLTHNIPKQEIHIRRLSERALARHILKQKTEDVPPLATKTYPTSNPPVDFLKIERQAFDLTDLLTSKGSGVIQATLSDHASDTLFVSTDLAITAQNDAIWVTRHSDSSPVADATIKIWEHDKNEPVEVIQTDEQGMARSAALRTPFDSQPKAPLPLITASSQEDISYLRPARQRYNQTYNKLRSHVVTDRGIYQPGETVHVVGWTREWSGQQLVILRDASLEVELLSARRESSLCQVRTTMLGGWSCAFELPEHASSGEYALRVAASNGPASDSQAVQTIHVERISPPRFQVHLQHIKSRKRLDGQVQRLAGPGMPHATIEYAIHTRPVAWSTPVHPEFHFGQEGKRSTLLSGQLKSDRKGNFSIDISKLPRTTAPHERWLEVSARDTDGVTTRNSIKWLELPKKVHGVRFSHRDEFSAARPYQELHVDVVTLRPDAPQKPLRTGSVKIEFLRQSLRSQWREGPGGERERVTIVDEETIIHRCKIRRVKTYASCIYRPGENGSIIRVSVGGRIVHEERFLVSSHPTPAEDIDTFNLTSELAHYRAGEIARLFIQVPFSTKETSTLLLMEGQHFPTGEQKSTTGRQTLWMGVTALRSGSQVIDVPIDRHIHPQHVSLTAHVVQGRYDRRKQSMQFQDPIWKHWNFVDEHSSWDRSFEPGRPGARTLHTGFEILPPEGLDPPTLSVKTSKTSYLPKEEVEIEVTLEGESTLAEALVMVVDEGALAMTGHKVERPHFTTRRDFFHTSPSPSSDSRHHITTPREVGMKSNPGGGGSAAFEESTEPRQEKEVTAHVELVALDPVTRRATVRFKAPERISDYRVMVLATRGANRHDFARGTASFHVTKPLHIRPSLPPFFSKDDLVTLRGMVTASQPGIYEVHAKLDDLLVLEGSDATQLVEITHPDEVAHVSWTVRVEAPPIRDDSARETHITLTASSHDAASSSVEDSVKVTRPVRHTLDNQTLEMWRDGTQRTRTYSASKYGLIMEDGIRIPLDLSPFDIDEEARLTVTIHDSYSDSIRTLIRDLNQYPHGCAEQTSTKLHGLLTLYENFEQINRYHHLVRKEEINRYVAHGLKRLKSMIHRNGNVSLWPHASNTNIWLTAYVAWVHVRANAILPDLVSQHYLSKLLDALTQHVQHDQRRHIAPSTLALAHYVLTLANIPQPNHLAALYDKRDEYARETNALLAMSYNLLDAPTQRDTLLELALDATRELSDKSLYGSTLRAQSIIALATAPASREKRRQATQFMEEFSSLPHLTTQEKSFLLMAITNHHVDSEQTSREVFAYQNAQLTNTATLKEDTPYTQTFSLAKMREEGIDELSFRLSNARASQATYTLHIVAKRLRRPPREWEELRSARIYVHAQGDRTGQPVTEPLRVGDVIAVHHFFSCKSTLYDLAILDPLPPGLERVHDPSNTSLSEQHLFDKTRRTSIPGPFSQNEVHAREFYQETLPTAEGIYPRDCRNLMRTSYLARAMTPGTYHIWPSYLERMYRPEYNYFTHNDGETITIIE